MALIQRKLFAERIKFFWIEYLNFINRLSIGHNKMFMAYSKNFRECVVNHVKPGMTWNK